MYNQYLIDRYTNKHQIYPMLFKDAKEATKGITKVIDMLMLGGTRFERFRTDGEYTLIEQREELQKLLRYATKEGANIDTFDIHMAKVAFIKLIGFGRMDDSMTEFKSGTVIIDRNGNEHNAYSYLVVDFEKAMELLQKIDTVNMANNVTEDNSKDAMLEIVYLALDGRESKEDIAKYLDSEFCRKAIRTYFDLPVLN